MENSPAASPTGESFDTGFTISNGELQYNGRPLLHDVPSTVKLSQYASICSKDPPLLSTSASSDGAFIGFNADIAESRHVFSLGKLKATRFTSIFRFKLWWATQWVGDSGSDVETETQVLILDTHAKAACDGVHGYPYILLLPIYEGKFRASLQAGMDDYLDVCVESGSTLVCESSFISCVYVHACHDPFLLVKDAVKVMRSHLGTFKVLEEKASPSIVDTFGWCTWDAFYLTVHPEGIWDGVKALVDGGVPPKFIIIDDGWQSTGFDHEDPSQDATQQTIAGDQMWCRLTRIAENFKFRNYTKGSLPKKKLNKETVACDGIIDAGLSMSLEACDGITDEGLSMGLGACDGISIEHLNQESNGLGASDGVINKHLKQERMGSGACDGVSNEHSQQEIMGLVTCNDASKQESTGLKAFIGDLKREYTSLEDVYVWHALAGYWGGVRPGVNDSFDAELVHPVLAPGLSTMMEDLAVDKLVSNSIGLVPPENALNFYDSMHSYLAQNGVSGVKLDVIQVLDLLGEKYGGRIELCKAYYKALGESIRKNLGGNRVIASMENCNDFMLLGTEEISFGRVGDDFWPQDVNGNPLLWLQGFHMVHCAYNSVWIGQFIHPDWDMFQTTHPSAPFHAASRAISGGPIYVSDKPGHHDFSLLKRLVFPDGTIPRCAHFALPTRDCLFLDPMHDGMTILKIWNLNKCGGVIGAFNCQGGGWSREKRMTLPSPTLRVTCSTSVSPQDIEWSHASSLIHLGDVEVFAVYSMKLDKILMLMKDESINLKLDPLDYDIFTLFPLQNLAKDLTFAPIGLLNMMNSGGSVESLESNERHVNVKVRGAGDFCAYASCRPKSCKRDGTMVDFSYNSTDGRVLVQVPWKDEPSSLEFVL